MIKKAIKKLIKNSKLCKKVSDIYRSEDYSSLSYSQNAEDLFVKNYFPKGFKGFYVDIGAHHPVRFSNTHLLYKEGWRGINIDPLPGAKKIFDKFRPEDVNLEICISEGDDEKNYYDFEEKAYNTIDTKISEYYISQNYSKLIKIIKFHPYSLSYILDKYCNYKIDLLTIDIECAELSALKTNNWSIYRPDLIIIESSQTKNANIVDMYNDVTLKYLLDNGYIIIGKFHNAVFAKNNVN